MGKKMKTRIVAAVVIEVLSVIILGIFLSYMQMRLTLNNQYTNTKEKLDAMQATIDAADEAAAQNESSYDEVYRSKAESVAFMVNNDESFEMTDSYMGTLAGMMNVSNILLLDSEGRTIASAEKSAADFTAHRFDQLRTVFEEGEPSDAFEVTIDGETRRYYAAKIDGTSEAVIEHDPEELSQLQDETSSWKSILGNIQVGLDGFSFAVSNQDYTFLYYPDADMIGQDSLDAGIQVEQLEDGQFSWMTINDNRYYCGVKSIPDDDAYVVCAVPEEELVSSRNITVGVVLFLFFAVITIIVVYALLTLQDNAGRDIRPGRLSYNKTVGRRMLTFSAVGLVVLFAASFYMQTLFSLSQRCLSNTSQADEVMETLDDKEEEVELLTAQYNRRYLNKCQVAAYILSRNPELRTKEKLSELSEILGAEFLLIFDKNGKEVVSDSTYINFRISDDPEDQSYEFNSLLNGLPYFIQEAMPDEVSGEYRQYIGVLLTDEDGDTDGFVQMAVVPEKLEQALAATSLSSVLETVKAGAGGFAFAVDKEDGTFTYYPESKLVGRSAVEYGMKESQLSGNLRDYITIDGKKLFASSLETDTHYIYVATPQSRIMGTRIQVSAACAGASLVSLLLLFMVLAFGNVTEAAQGKTEAAKAKAGKGPMIDVRMPDGSSKKTKAAASRWSYDSVFWSQKTPEQKTGFLLKALLAVFAVLICIAVLLKDRLFEQDSIFRLILDGNWEKGLNVFALTGCILIICVAGILVMVLQEALRLMGKALGARGATICRLLHSFLKYVSVIAILYYCLALVGVDTATLLASAGILSLVIGLGAQKLVSDILAGLFIIFEGDFQVGDIVTIGDWRGTVQEIGVRTTKIVDPGQNVKIISNSSVSGVINMTRQTSFCSCDVGIEYAESLERVESILAKELPKMKETLPAILDGPFYKGVVSLGDNSVNIRIVAQCKESDKAQLGRDLNRQMKLLFDKHDINIPFPQVVINEPKEYQQATAKEKQIANQFNEQQKELTKDIQKEI